MSGETCKRRRWPWIVVGAAFLLWLVPAAFVALHDPRTPALSGAVDDPLARALGDEGHAFFLLSHGYAKSWSVESWEGEDESTVDKTWAHYTAQRGPLDRKAGTFPLVLGGFLNHAADLRAVRLLVTSDEAWSGEGGATWTLVAETPVDPQGADTVVFECRGEAPASATAYRIQEVREGAILDAFSQSMLTAPTAAGRVYDAIAWWPIFRWVPSLR